MHSTLVLCSCLLAFSTLGSASYRALPRRYDIRNANRGTNATAPTSSMSSSLSSTSISESSSTSSYTSRTSSTSTTSAHSSSSLSLITSESPSCAGSYTYYGAAPPTVTLTKTEGYDTTITASNAPLSTPIITPPPPCFETIAPAPSSASTACRGNCPLNNPDETGTIAVSSIDYTSTVYVTKKTPVPTVVPQTSAPPDFQPTSTPLTSPSPAPAEQSGHPVSGGTTNNAAPPPVTSKNQDVSPGQSTGGSGGSPTTAPAPNKSQGNNGGQSPGQPSTSPNVGSLVNSGIGGKPQTTPAAAISGGSGEGSLAAPSTTVVNNVPVVVLPSSSVVIGGQLVSVPPANSPKTVQANGNTFTIQNSQIIGPSATIPMAAVAGEKAGSTTVAAGGLTFAVGATQAVVSGHTYAIGNGAPQETEVIGSKTVVFGSAGVEVPGQTLAPEKITAAPSFLVTSVGGISLSVDATEVVLGSSTYRIGQGASQTVVIYAGKTLTLGSQGVAMGSSTIPPAVMVPTPTLSAVTLAGLSLSVDATEVVVGSQSFRIGSGAPTETTVIAGKTLTIGPDGIAVGSTTLTPPAAGATLPAGLQTAAAPSTISAVVDAWSMLMFTAFLALMII